MGKWFYPFISACAVVNVCWIVFDFLTGKPANVFVWLFAVGLQIDIALECLLRWALEGEHEH